MIVGLCRGVRSIQLAVSRFCVQMMNHYHQLVETIDGNLCRGMRGRKIEPVDKGWPMFDHPDEIYLSSVEFHSATSGTEASRAVVSPSMVTELSESPISIALTTS